MSGGVLQFGGVRIPIIGASGPIVSLDEVRSGTWEGLRPIPDDRMSRRHRTVDEVSLIVVHYGGRSPEHTLRIFDARAELGQRVGTHILVGRDGLVAQVADLAVPTWHAGSPWNRRSIGIDVAFVRRPREGDRTADQVIHGERRATGRQGRYSGPVVLWTAAMVQSVAAVCRALVGDGVAAWAFPLAWADTSDDPRADAALLPPVPMGSTARVSSTLWTPHSAARGIVGHYHLTRRRWDPGLDGLQAMAMMET